MAISFKFHEIASTEAGLAMTVYGPVFRCHYIILNICSVVKGLGKKYLKPGGNPPE